MQKEKIAELKKLLKKAETSDPSDVKKEAEEFLNSVDVNDLVSAEQELLDEGMEPENLRHLCSAHIEMMGDGLSGIKEGLETTHPIRTLISEHEEILKFLDALDKLDNKIKQFGFAKEDTKELQHIAHHLEAAEKHHQREEDVLFPELEKRGIFGPTEIMRAEHVGLRAHKKELSELANTSHKKDYAHFKNELDRVIKYITFNLRDHIFKENNILYPAALDLIQDEKAWEDIKKRCDKIGYCCFTPEDVQASD